jgi:hypothetical protein
VAPKAPKVAPKPPAVAKTPAAPARGPQTSTKYAKKPVIKKHPTLDPKKDANYNKSKKVRSEMQNRRIKEDLKHKKQKQIRELSSDSDDDMSIEEPKKHFKNAKKDVP